MQAPWNESAAAIRRQWTERPHVGIILGTGLGNVAAQFEVECELAYETIPHFPRSTALSHQGRLVCGRLRGVPAVAMAGRCHLYEGYRLEQLTLPVRVMRALGVEANEIDIRPSCMQMLKDIDHPYAVGQTVYDITFENIQAGERTSHLFRIANLRNALVIGTGDLSELALGWCTYGVGDHMSHYNINASVPKTLIQHLIRWVAHSEQVSPETSEILIDILETEISPELVPGQMQAQPSQRTESIVGPYELQDFNNYYTTRFGYLPTKIAFISYCTWRDKTQGHWPDVPEA